MTAIAVQPPPGDTPGAVLTPRPKLLVVDDQMLNIEVMYAAFGTDHQVFGATSGAAGLALCAKVRPDLVLLDVAMPDMDGFAVCAQLKADPALRDIPVIFITVHDDEASEVHGLKVGAVDFITKPINPRTVRARVSTQLTLRARSLQLQHEIAERKAVQQALDLYRHELARSNADLEQFAYAASHDLLEPLRSVTGAVQLLKKRSLGQLDAQALVLVDHAVAGAARMQALIADLLVLSRVGGGSRPRAVASLEAALSLACQNLQTAIAESGARITHGALPAVLADTSQMALLLQNLLANAIKFRGDKPAVVHVEARQEANEWVVSVADQGIGIAPQHFDRIFNLFKRLHTQEEYGGTGIGLALCKKIMERSGGRIWVESVAGQGATFYFALPITKV